MYKSGYQGEDSMRDYAERMMRDEVKGSRKGPVPRSMSAPEATKMRPFKKGGHAHHHAQGGMEEAMRNAKGNRARQASFSNIGKEHIGGHAYDDGGLAAAKRGFMQERMAGSGFGRLFKKKGGKAEHKMFGGPMGGMSSGIASPRNWDGSLMSQGDIFRKYGNVMFKKGGKAHKKADGGWLQGLEKVPFPARQYKPTFPRDSFARGGNVDQDEHEGSYHSRSPRHRMEETQSNMRIPNKTRNSVTSRDVSNENAHYKRGGRGDNMRLNIETERELENFGKKRGGSAHRHHHHHHGEHDMRRMHREEHEFAKKHGKHHKGIGGLLGGLAGTYFGGPLGGMAGSALGNFLPFAEGGMPAKRRGGHMKHKASGGTIYERQMNGERPGRTPHHYNYEAEMRGEKPVRTSSSRHQSKKGLHDMEHGQMFAAGGAGKIRKGQMTARGTQQPNRRVIRNDLF